jgi:molybdopterin converting factor small subunit
MHLTDQNREIEVKGTTVRECLKDLVRQYPGVKPLVITRNGRLLRTMDIYINGQSAYPGEMAKPVKDGDFLQIVNIVFGG